MQKKPEIIRKNARRKYRKTLNHKLFSENFIHDQLNIFSKPMGHINIRIIQKKFKRDQ